jgi:type I restriction enzyme S subunit
MNKNIPIGWTKKKLGDLGQFSTSSVDKKSTSDEKYVRLLNYMDVYRTNFITSSIPLQSITASDREISSFLVKKGDVFFTPSSETPDDIGHSAVVLDDLVETLQSYHLVRLRLHDPNSLDLNYRAWAFQSQYVLNQFRLFATGSTRFTLSLGDFRDTDFIYPLEKSEQKKIAAILSSVDQVIHLSRLKITKLYYIKKATMSELLTRGINHKEFKVTPLGHIPASWGVNKLDDVARRASGHTPNKQFPEYWNGGIK